MSTHQRDRRQQVEQQIEALIGQTLREATAGGLVASDVQFINDLGDLDRIHGLLESEDATVREYGQVLMNLREQTALIASGLEETGDAGAAYESPPPPVVSLPQVPAPPVVERPHGALPKTSADAPAESGEADASSREIDALLRAKLQRMVDRLGTQPLLQMDFRQVPEVHIDSPFTVQEEHRLLVLNFLAPLMLELGIVGISVAPTFYDPFRDTEQVLDLSKPVDTMAYLRSILR